MNQQHNLSSSHSISYSPVNKVDSNDQNVVYSGAQFYISPIVSTQLPSPGNYYYDQNSHYPFPQVMVNQNAQMSSHNKQNSANTCSPSSIMMKEPPTLVTSSSSTTTDSSMSSSSVEFLNEAYAKAASLPESFYPEFLQYSKEAYEQSTGSPNPKKFKRSSNMNSNEKSRLDNHSKSRSDDSDNDDSGSLSQNEIRRQIHIQSEQKRRAQIKDGFEELRNELPTCLNKKMSKVALLHRTVQHIQHLKDTQNTVLSELERLVHENEQLRKFHDSVLQKQALENMYGMTNL